MYRYNVYIFKQLAWSTLLVGFTLTGIVWLTQALRFVDYIINRGVSFLTFLHLTALIIPSLLTVVLPFSLLAAVLFTYYKLITDSELVVLQSAGLSRRQIARPAIQFAACIMVFGYFITLYLLPLTYSQFRDMQAFLRDNYASLLLQEEVFNSPVEGLTVFIQSREDNGTLHGILVHDNRENTRPVTMMAQEGKLMQTTQGPRFLLVNGNRQEVQNGRLSVLNFDSYTLDISFYAKKHYSRSAQPEEMYLKELFTVQGKDEKDVLQARAEGHQRIVWPLYNLALTLICLGLLLGQEFNRRGSWTRIALSLILGVAFLAGSIGLENLAARSTAMVVAMYSFIIGAFALGVYLMVRESLKRPSAFKGITQSAASQ